MDYLFQMALIAGASFGAGSVFGYAWAEYSIHHKHRSH